MLYLAISAVGSDMERFTNELDCTDDRKQNVYMERLTQ